MINFKNNRPLIPNFAWGIRYCESNPYVGCLATNLGIFIASDIERLRDFLSNLIEEDVARE